VTRLYVILALLHGYIAWRLLPALGAGSVAGIALIAWLALSVAVMPLGFSASRLRDRRVGDAATWVGMLAAGAFSSLLVLTVARDVIVLVAHAIAATAAGSSITAETLAHWVRASASWVPVVAVLVSVIGVVNARLRAAIRHVDVPIAGLPASLDGFIIEVNGTDIIRDLSLARDIAKQGRYHKIAISIDDLGEEWSSLMGLHDFPFVEIKVDREFVSGCADDRLKRTMCRQIRELAENYGARTVAEGVDTRPDFLAVRELGFDMVQGSLLGKPMRMRKFARTIMRQSVKMPE
jgi:predicted signal transduction protein with EAL and GGDEF domain